MKKIDFKAVVSAVAAGGGYNFAIEGMAKRVDFVNNNFLVVKSLGAGLLLLQHQALQRCPHLPTRLPYR